MIFFKSDTLLQNVKAILGLLSPFRSVKQKRATLPRVLRNSSLQRKSTNGKDLEDKRVLFETFIIG